MGEATRQGCREEQAKREIGHTDFSPGVAPFLVVGFLVAIVSVPLLQLGMAWRETSRTGRAPSVAFVRRLPDAISEATRAWRAGSTPLDGLLNANAALLGGIQQFEADMDDTCVLTRATRAPVQDIMCRLGVGNEEAFVGNGGWLFFEPDISYLTGSGFLEAARLRARLRAAAEHERPPQPDPSLAILHMQLQLAERGIRLVVVPAPVKPSIHPERFSHRMKQADLPVQNVSYAQFVNELCQPRGFLDGRLGEWETQGTGLPANAWREYADQLRAGRDLLEKCPPLFFDPAPILAKRTRRLTDAQYLATDTHWTPDAMQEVAAALATFIREQVTLPPADRSTMSTTQVEVTAQGDIAGMLGLPEGQTLYAKETVRIRQIARGRNLWRPDPNAPVLLLGDSFTNTYSLNAMGWGESAGFAEQLSYELGVPLDVMARNDAGARATRTMLSRELRRGRDRLAGKKIVVYEFAARELAVGDWTMLDLTLGQPDRSTFFVPEEGQSVEVEGTVASVTAAPRPGSVPYRDHLVTVHLVDIQSTHVAAQGGEALVFMRSMADNKWLPPARYRLGERLQLRLRRWTDCMHRYKRINRAESANDELEFEEPCWGEELEQRQGEK